MELTWNQHNKICATFMGGYMYSWHTLIPSHLIGHHSGHQIYLNIGYFVILWSREGSQPPHISGSPGWAPTLPQALFFSRKMAPYFWKPWMAPYVAAGAFFFFQKNGPLILGVTHKWIWIWIYPVCDSMGYPVNKGEGLTKSSNQTVSLNGAALCKIWTKKHSM